MSKELKKIQIEAIPGTIAGILESYFPPLAIFLGISGHKLTYIFSYPRLIYSFFQLYVNKVVNFFRSKKKALIVLTWIQFAIVFSLFTGTLLIKTYLQSLSPLAFLIVTFSVYYLLATMRGIIWNVWVQNYLPETEKYKFFGNRVKLVNTVFLAISLLLSAFFTIFKNYSFFGIEGELICFSILFIISMVSLIISAILFSQIPDLEYVEDFSEESVNLKFLRDIKNRFSKEYLYLLSYATLLHVSVFISAPFSAEYILKEKELTYFHLMLFSINAAIIKILLSPVIGGLVSRFGPAKMFRLGMFLMAITLFGWSFMHNYLFILLFDSIGQIGWAIWDSLITLLIYEYTNQKNRISAFSLFNLMIGLGCFLGSSIAGLLFLVYKAINPNLVYNFVFATSFALRILFFGIFAKKIIDLKPYESKRYTEIITLMFASIPEHSWLFQRTILILKKAFPWNIIPLISIDKFIKSISRWSGNLFNGNRGKELIREINQIIDEVNREIKVRNALEGIEKIDLKPTKEEKIPDLPQAEIHGTEEKEPQDPQKIT
ncbi:MAG: MFS transporter [Candidatus Woesearchaeota archaeon]